MTTFTKWITSCDDLPQDIADAQAEIAGLQDPSYCYGYCDDTDTACLLDCRKQANRQIAALEDDVKVFQRAQRFCTFYVAVWSLDETRTPGGKQMETLTLMGNPLTIELGLIGWLFNFYATIQSESSQGYWDDTKQNLTVTKGGTDAYNGSQVAGTATMQGSITFAGGMGTWIGTRIGGLSPVRKVRGKGQVHKRLEIRDDQVVMLWPPTKWQLGVHEADQG